MLYEKKDAKTSKPTNESHSHPAGILSFLYLRYPFIVRVFKFPFCRLVKEICVDHVEAHEPLSVVKLGQLVNERLVSLKTREGKASLLNHCGRFAPPPVEKLDTAFTEVEPL